MRDATFVAPRMSPSTLACKKFVTDHSYDFMSNDLTKVDPVLYQNSINELTPPLGNNS